MRGVGRPRAGFFRPSLDGGLPLLPLFSPSWRSSSATRATSAAFCARNARISANKTDVSAASSLGAQSSERGVINTLTHVATWSVNRFLVGPTWAVTL